MELAVLLALADGEIDEAETAALGETLAAAFGGKLADIVIRALIEETAEQIRAEGAESRARALGSALSSAGARDAGLRIARAIAESSEGVSGEEAALLELLAAG